MKISYNNYPILKSLRTKMLGSIPVYEQDAKMFQILGKEFARQWKIKVSDFASDINVVSETFERSAKEAAVKLSELHNEIAGNDSNELKLSGTYIVGGFVYMISYEIIQNTNIVETFYYVFDKSGIPISFMLNTSDDSIGFRCFLSENIEIGVQRTNKSVTEYIEYSMQLIIIFALFKQYADVDTKVVGANSRVKEFGCKYINDTEINITHLDCKWFTNIVNSEGFKVRGHFRLQPIKKDGKWTRELIWINEFKKHGYLSKAKKLLYGDS